MARSQSGKLAQVLMYILPVGALGLIARVAFAEGTSAATYAVVGALLVPVALGFWWAWGHSRALVAVALDGGGLVISGHGRHSLSAGSLHALRAREMPGSLNTMYTVVFVRLPLGSVRLAIPSILPDHLYADGNADAGDLYFEHDAVALLDQLTPYIMPADVRAAPPVAPTFSIVLRRRIPLPTREDRCLYLAGDSIALAGESAVILARARRDQIVSTAFRFGRMQSIETPSFPDAPALMLGFPAERIDLSVGTNPPDLEERWRELPEGPSPEYMVGYGELMKLMSTLDRPRDGGA